MQPPADTALTLATLGQFTLSDPSGRLLLGPGKPLALLAYLAALPGRTASREHLIDLLWADSEPERARHALRQALWQLRQVLGEHCLEGREEIRLACDVGSDRNRFLATIEAGDLEAAIDTYGGPFIAAFASPGGAAFEHWADAERTQLENAFVRAAELRTRRLLASGHGRDAVAIARRVIEADPIGQAGRRLLIEAHLASGDAISAATEAETMLRIAREEELDLEPASQAIAGRALGQQPATVGGLDTPPSPGRITADLVGREREFATILAAWGAARASTPRHLHLVGAAGLGKTRLLLDLEARLRSTGARVRYVRAHPGDRDLPGALASELARALATLPGAKGVAPEVASTLVALDPSLANVYRATGDPATGVEARRRRILALTELLRATTEEGPCALLVDDLHWSDPDSLAILEALVARLDRMPLLVVTATRPVPDTHFRSEHRQAIPLDPLTAAQVEELLESLGRFDSPEAATRIATHLHAAAHGNPLLVLELLSLASEQELLRVEDGTWSGSALYTAAPVFASGDGLRQRFDRLDGESRRVMTVLALAGAPLDLATLLDAAGLDVATGCEHLATLERLGFVHPSGDTFETTHDELAAVALESDGEEQAALRRRLGTALTELADGSVASLARAAQQLVVVGDVAALARLVGRARRTLPGRRRSLDETLHLLLGAGRGAELAPAVRRALPLRERLPHGLLVATAALAFLVLGAAIGQRVLAARQEARSIVFEVAWQTDSIPAWRTARLLIDPATWDPLHPPTIGPGEVRNEPYVNWQAMAEYAPDGSWLLTSSSPDSAFTGSQDIVGVRDGEVHAYASAPRDDVAPRFLPDGSGFVFVTSRWSPDSTDTYSVARYDFATGTVTPIVNSLAREDNPVVSTDGTRIAYASLGQDDVYSRLCVVAIDGRDKRCFERQGSAPATPIAWLDDSSIAVHASIGGRYGLVRVDARTGESRTIVDLAAKNAAVDRRGEFMICLCLNPEDNQTGLLAIPLHQSGRSAWLASPTSFKITGLWSVHSRAAPRYLDALTIDIEDTLPIGRSLRPRVLAFDADRRPMRVDTTMVRWRVTRGTGVIIDSLTGRLRAATPTTATIEASAGGWRVASKELVFVEPVASLLLDESWDSLSLTTRWRPWGQPKPVIRPSPSLGRALFINGDQSYHSGVYSTETWPASQGLTVEVEVSTPVNSPRHQVLDLRFGASADSALLGLWDHTVGTPPGYLLTQLGECAMMFPPFESRASWSMLSASTGDVTSQFPIDPGQVQGRPHRWRITVFPDGSCGTAVDSVPRAFFKGPISLRYPLRLWVDGQSYATDIAVGRLRVWRGDPGGVDWESLDQPDN